MDACMNERAYKLVICPSNHRTREKINHKVKEHIKAIKVFSEDTIVVQNNKSLSSHFRKDLVNKN